METLCYFYHPDPSIWLSVDPMSDKYPNLTPYAYCANNPVILVDPDGREVEGFSIDESGQVKMDYDKASNDAVELYNAMNKTETGTQAFIEMIKSETKINIIITDEILNDKNGKEFHGFLSPKDDGDGNYLYTKKRFLSRSKINCFDSRFIIT
jgi:hypothetical protein